MSFVTLKILEGIDRGKVYSDLAPPITIGREDDNAVRLNDERVSRFHAKIQQSDGKLILTDLQSTNGTRVNGYPVHIRVLQHGDHIWIGRCLLVYDEESRRDKKSTTDLFSLDEQDIDNANDVTMAVERSVQQEASGRSEAFDDSDEDFSELFPQGPPALPTGMSPAQKAAVSDLIAFAHAKFAQLIFHAREVNSDNSEDFSDATDEPGMFIPARQWQELLKLEMEFATYMNNILDP